MPVLSISQLWHIRCIDKLCHHSYFLTPLLFINHSLAPLFIEFFKDIHSFRKLISINFLLWFPIICLRNVFRSCHDLGLIISLPPSIQLFFQTFLEIFDQRIYNFFCQPSVGLFQYIDTFSFDCHKFLSVQDSYYICEVWFKEFHSFHTINC